MSTDTSILRHELERIVGRNVILGQPEIEQRIYIADELVTRVENDPNLWYADLVATALEHDPLWSFDIVGDVIQICNELLTGMWTTLPANDSDTANDNMHKALKPDAYFRFYATGDADCPYVVVTGTSTPEFRATAIR